VLDDYRSAPIEPKLRATLGFIEKLTLAPETLLAADARALRDAGLSDAAIEDAIHVCALFSIYDRLADSLAFEIPDKRGFAQSASHLLSHGYL
jgi:alkylhydroperoxidase family enzyme